jgi:hypothetical protein
MVDQLSCRVPRERGALDGLLAVLAPRPRVRRRVALADALGPRAAHVGQRHVHHPLVRRPPPPARSWRRRRRRCWGRRRPGAIVRRNTTYRTNLALAAGHRRRRHRRPVAPLAVHGATRSIRIRTEPGRRAASWWSSSRPDPKSDATSCLEADAPEGYKETAVAVRK